MMKIISIKKVKESSNTTILEIELKNLWGKKITKHIAKKVFLFRDNDEGNAYLSGVYMDTGEHIPLDLDKPIEAFLSCGLEYFEPK